MGVDALQRSSLAYRKWRSEIWQGRVPEKYTRLLPYIQGSPILELGSAEGVLSLLLAKRGGDVIGLELRPERHEEALRLKRAWSGRAKFVCGDIREHLHLLQRVETLVAVRAIYYLRNDAPAVMAFAAAAGIRRVVLCGNGNRAARYQHNPHDDLGKFNRLASVEGMSELLARAGYSIAQLVREGDPIVIGRLGDG